MRFTNSTNLAFLIVAVIVVLIHGSCGIYLIEGDSMSPKLKDKDLIIVLFNKNNISVDDIVVFMYEEEVYIKKINEIKDDSIYVIGYNSNSYDSRYFGYINKSNIIGKYYAKIF